MPARSTSRIRQTGAAAKHGVAVVVAPRLTLPLLDGVDRPLVPVDRWADTALLLPPGLAEIELRNAFTDTVHRGARLPIGTLLERFPVALLIAAG